MQAAPSLQDLSTIQLARLLPRLPIWAIAQLAFAGVCRQTGGHGQFAYKHHVAYCIHPSLSPMLSDV